MEIESKNFPPSFVIIQGLNQRRGVSRVKNAKEEQILPLTKSIKGQFKIFKEQILRFRYNFLLMSRLHAGVSQLVFRDGKLVPKSEEDSARSHRVISYAHTVTSAPDQYYTKAIKEYKKEIDSLKKNYSQLQRAYWGLLGYRPTEGDENEKENYTEIHDTPRILKGKFPLLNSTNITNATEDSLRKGIPSLVNVSSFELGGEPEEEKKRLTDCSVSAIEEELNCSLWTGQLHSRQLSSQHDSSSCNDEKSIMKSENDEEEEEEGISEKLFAAFKEISCLKEALQQAQSNSEHKAKEIREDYEEHIKKLEEILERERKNSRMLNGVINRLRNELNTKDGVIKNIMNMKTLDKSGFDKLLKQFKTQ